MKNETEKSVLLSCGVFCFRIRASYGVTSPFRLTLGRDFCCSEKSLVHSLKKVAIKKRRDAYVNGL